MDSFVAEHGLAGKIWVYKTSFRGSPWYVVVQGDYASSAQAKAAILSRPPCSRDNPGPSRLPRYKKN